MHNSFVKRWKQYFIICCIFNIISAYQLERSTFECIKSWLFKTIYLGSKRRELSKPCVKSPLKYPSPLNDTNITVEFSRINFKDIVIRLQTVLADVDFGSTGVVAVRTGRSITASGDAAILGNRKNCPLLPTTPHLTGGTNRAGGYRGRFRNKKCIIDF